MTFELLNIHYNSSNLLVFILINTEVQKELLDSDQSFPTSLKSKSPGVCRHKSVSCNFTAISIAVRSCSRQLTSVR